MNGSIAHKMRINSLDAHKNCPFCDIKKPIPKEAEADFYEWLEGIDDYDNGSELFETYKDAIKRKLIQKIKLYDMSITNTGKTLELRSHEKRRLIEECLS